MRVWTDGRDYVLARCASRIPALMDDHYGVFGHELRGQWREVAPDDVVLVVAQESQRAVPLRAQCLVGLRNETWLGSTTWRRLRRNESTPDDADVYGEAFLKAALEPLE